MTEKIDKMQKNLHRPYDGPVRFNTEKGTCWGGWCRHSFAKDMCYQSTTWFGIVYLTEGVKVDYNLDGEIIGNLPEWDWEWTELPKNLHNQMDFMSGEKYDAPTYPKAVTYDHAIRVNKTSTHAALNSFNSLMVRVFLHSGYDIPTGAQTIEEIPQRVFDNEPSLKDALFVRPYLLKYFWDNPTGDVGVVRWYNNSYKMIAEKEGIELEPIEMCGYY